ncbi:MAG: efflux RND transporter periplasmic adaptor subunit [Deltaproteobacteria bacterium]|nr:efflux RND transporter periplasmic adaptor subunit [Deltaproteobacteria bacterium]
MTPALCALLAGAGGCSSRAAETGRANEPTASADARRVVKFDAAALARMGVTVEAAGDRTGKTRMTFPGSLDYALDRYAEVGTIVEGRVAAVHVKSGDPVVKGQPLAVVAVPALVEAQAQLAIAEASAKTARTQADRESALLDRALTTARESEVARNDADRGRAEADAARARLALLTGAPATAVGSAMGQLVLTAPMTGTVVRRDLVLGGRIQPSQTAFVVADLTTLWATVNVFESDLRHVLPQSKAEITVEAFPGRTFQGRVEVVEPHVGAGSRAARARIVVSNHDGLLKPGLFFEARVEAGHDDRSGLLVPRGAIQPLGGVDVVFVERGHGEFEIRKVRVASTSPQVAELTEGLERGERIAVTGASLLRAEATKQ